MIDPIEFGEMKSDIKALTHDNIEMKEVQKEMSKDIKTMRQILDEAKGGGKILLGVVAFMSSFFTIIFSWALKKFGIS